MQPTSIYNYIRQEEQRFETDEIQVGENWFWNFRKHVQLIFHLKNGIFLTGENNWLRQFRNFMEGIIELSNWTEDIDIGRDVTLFTENEEDRAITFLIKKAHDEIYVREHDLDKMVDEITETDNTYGGALAQRGAKRPEIIPLNRVAFCNQTDILGGPLAIKMNYSPSELRSVGKKRGWGQEKNGATISIEDLIILADHDKDVNGTSLNEKKNKTTGKTIEVYIIRGDMPESYLKEGGDEEKSVSQIQIVALYTDEENNKQGVTLYRKEDKDGLEFFSSNEVEGRALGRGVGEKILPDQIWSNWKIIHKNGLLEAAAKVPLVTDDPSYTNKNKIQEMENLEVTVIDEGKKIGPISTAMLANIQVFEKALADDFQHAQFAGQSYNSLMGIEESSGTTFRGQNQLIQQGRGPHDRRRGQRAKFIEKIYRKWIIPDLIRELKAGKKFWATLSTDEMMWVADQLAICSTNKRVKEMILQGKMVTKEEQMMMMQVFKQDFFKKGNKHLLEILEGQLEGIEDRIGINIAGKQKNLAGISDRILSIIEVAIQNPQFRANLEANGMMNAFNDLLEYSGLSPADFAMVANAKPVLSPIQKGDLAVNPEVQQ